MSRHSVRSHPDTERACRAVQYLLPPEATAYLMRDPQWCLAQSEKIGERCLELVHDLFTHRVLDNLRAVQGLLQLQGRYGKRRLEAACARALAHGAGTNRNVKNILEKGLDQQKISLPIALPDAYGGTSRFTRNSALLN